MIPSPQSGSARPVEEDESVDPPSAFPVLGLDVSVSIGSAGPVVGTGSSSPVVTVVPDEDAFSEISALFSPVQ
jgi:hypothetical protein